MNLVRKYQLKPTKRYKKDLKRLQKKHIDLGPLNIVLNLLADGKVLPERYRDHALSGDLKHARECHIGPDWLLLYIKDNDQLLLLLISTGDHRQTLGIE